jgi:hypothetical protein
MEAARQGEAGRLVATVRFRASRRMELPLMLLQLRSNFWVCTLHVEAGICVGWGLERGLVVGCKLGEFRQSGFCWVLGVKLREVLMPKLPGKTLVSKLLQRCFSFFCEVSRVSLPESFSASEKFSSPTPPSVAFFPPLRRVRSPRRHGTYSAR